MTEGFIYVLKNPHMPRLVKIGYTDRSPWVRARELGNHTGVPGDFSVVKSWRVQNAAAYEKRYSPNYFYTAKLGSTLNCPLPKPSNVSPLCLEHGDRSAMMD
jgi:hypothetical protein